MDSVVEDLKELMYVNTSDHKTEYDFFKTNYREVACSLDGLKTSTIDSEQLEDIDSSLDTDEFRRVMDHYTDIGIITSETDTRIDMDDEFYEVTVYSIGGRHGKGFSRSWEDITDNLEDKMQEAEEVYCWEQQAEGSYRLTDFE